MRWQVGTAKALPRRLALAPTIKALTKANIALRERVRRARHRRKPAVGRRARSTDTPWR
ncbi:MAG TPA: hypothetical protein VFN09_10605 [Rhodanobacteraceae bacterium]|nr:hypothetical protein [Rhodanobacteraceae bacterium]